MNSLSEAPLSTIRTVAYQPASTANRSTTVHTVRMKLNRILPLLLLLGLCSIAAPSAFGQVKGYGFGPKIGLYLDQGRLMVGAIGEFPVAAAMFFEPGAEIIFGIKNTTRLVADLNARYTFLVKGASIEPFIIAGLAGRIDIYQAAAGESFTDTGFRLNLGGGVTVNPRSLMQPWAGVKIFFLDDTGTDLALQGGVNFYF